MGWPLPANVVEPNNVQIEKTISIPDTKYFRQDFEGKVHKSLGQKHQKLLLTQEKAILSECSCCCTTNLTWHVRVYKKYCDNTWLKDLILSISTGQTGTFFRTASTHCVNTEVSASAHLLSLLLAQKLSCYVMRHLPTRSTLSVIHFKQVKYSLPV